MLQSARNYSEIFHRVKNTYLLKKHCFAFAFIFACSGKKENVSMKLTGNQYLCFMESLKDNFMLNGVCFFY